MARKKTQIVTTAASEVTRTALVPMLGSPQAVAKIASNGGSILHEQGATLVSGRVYITRDQVIPADEVYFVRDVRPDADGPWLGEADKVAWRDEATGYECIMMRDTQGGYLSGYVGVPIDHPLHGFSEDAVPADIGVEVHGGLLYADICQDGPTPERRQILDEARRICHAPSKPPRYVATSHGSDYRVEDAHAWWFGFSCNHLYDVIPNDTRGPLFLEAETGAVYRDDAYVCREVTNLAAQLRAIADGVPPPPRMGPPLPPIGLDPKGGA